MKKNNQSTYKPVRTSIWDTAICYFHVEGLLNLFSAQIKFEMRLNLLCIPLIIGNV